MNIQQANHAGRNMCGYGDKPPSVKWPGGARLALQFVLNYEEGAEQCVLHGDSASESFLSDIVNARPYESTRHMSMESLYEYGSRTGVWRILKEFRDRRMPLTVFAVAMAMQKNPDVARAILDDGHEIASHGWRWIDYQFVDEDTERDHIKLAVETLTELTGEPPLGWYTGRDSPNTRRLVVEHGGFLYDSDSYADDLPYWQTISGQSHLVIPYSLDCNDMRFATPNGFATGNDFFEYLRDAFNVLYAEGADAPKMMSVGLHCRLAGRPGRFAALARFLEYVQQHDDVWVCRRVDIARHWVEHHPAGGV